MSSTIAENRPLSINQQKAFIVENATILNREIKIAILSIVMMEIGQSVIMENSIKEVDINLDAVAIINKDIITHIYNMVLTRRKLLNQPAGAQVS